MTKIANGGLVLLAVVCALLISARPARGDTEFEAALRDLCSDDVVLRGAAEDFLVRNRLRFAPAAYRAHVRLLAVGEDDCAEELRSVLQQIALTANPGRLVGGLSSEDYWVRASSEFLLDEMDSRAEAILIDNRNDPDMETRARVERLLRRRFSREVLPLVWQFFNALVASRLNVTPFVEFLGEPGDRALWRTSVAALTREAARNSFDVTELRRKLLDALRHAIDEDARIHHLLRPEDRAELRELARQLSRDLNAFQRKYSPGQ